jgi:hypothetical protein
MLLSEQLQMALVEAMGRDDIAVRWRKGSRLTVWIFRMEGEGPFLVGYGTAHRNWRQDALHRDVFTMIELEAASKGYERAVFNIALEVVYPVAFKRLRDEGPKKVTKPTGGAYRGAVTMNAWNKKLGKKHAVILVPEHKPSMVGGADGTRPMGIVR